MKQKDRRSFFQKMGIFLSSVPFLEAVNLPADEVKLDSTSDTERIFFTTGFKIAEVGQNDAIIWTRLCRSEFPVPIKHDRKKEGVNFYPTAFDENKPVKQMDGAVEGMEGQVRVKLVGANQEKISEWFTARQENDFTVQIPVDNLLDNTEYLVKLESRISENKKVFSVEGSFRTAPDIDKVIPVHLATCTCQYFWNYDHLKRGFKSYDSIRKIAPDFFIHTGDYIYYDRRGPLSTNIEKARHKWHAMDSRLSIKELYRSVPVYLLKDDHDLLRDDVYPDSLPLEEFTLEDGLKIWRENVPLKDKPYRTIRWGKDLQIWLVEGREYRSPRNVPTGEQRTIWGKEQKSWFQKTVNESDATFKILISATPVVGPDRKNKKDNHANLMFQNEGDWLRNFLSSQKRMYVVNGDRHWQYYSIDKETGVKEFGAGPVSDAMAGGWKQDDKRSEHQYLRVNGGFMSIKVYRDDGVPQISFTHYNVDGKVQNEEVFF
ncbi:alkaline phosphatase D family protein [Membranihabitans maritimus]|uniref:alkaline phosphatase D family protein n=1 Tax=Membranihabitans maritimus TaxID=2904244 RepID=UPI001F29E3E7|nr:alkaline phosphatase D family protein [Membranihabitans maritimus]